MKIYDKGYSCATCGKTVKETEITTSKNISLDLPACDCGRPFVSVYTYHETMIEEDKTSWIAYNKTYFPEVIRKYKLDKEENVKKITPVYVEVIFRTK